MMKRMMIKYFILAVLAVMIRTEFAAGQDTGILYQDTLTLNEISLDSIRFYLTRETSRAENTVKDTIFVTVGDKIYRIPYKVTSTALVSTFRGPQYFRMTGLSMSNDSLDYYMSELFRNPRERLRDSITARNWKNSEIYSQYFLPYDNKSENLAVSKEANENQNSGADEFEEFMSEGSDGYVEQNYVDFPLPQTIDLEVDLKKSPPVLNVLGINFNFNKLDPRFQKLLLRYGTSAQYQNRRSYELRGE